ncbi:MAG: hypothetical protein JW866_07625 [Ignavibacteriales bacterium]|nr:hypothetical protein [Ignavibacteriales bacterium]
MNSANCINCGASLKLDSHDKYIKCDYCQSYNSNFSSFDNIDLYLKNCDKSNNIFFDLQTAYKKDDFNKVKEISLSILTNSPESWIALTYLSIADFWLGYDDFSHVENIYGNLLLALKYSDNNEFVVDVSNKISNDIVVLGAKNQCYGEEFQHSINAFKIAQKISNFNDEAKKCIENYLNKAFQYQKVKLENLLNKNKKDYDPPYVSINALFNICYFIENKEILEFLYIHTKIHLDKGKTKSYFEILKNNLIQIENKLKLHKSKLVDKSISIGSNGIIRII